ncbi:GatB/YqeY domain-containing protein [Fusibacter paucivorans]|uniref:GatB/YqeY domain-containing protein n=1 Tax=Fusibacter paucivorans TaxID=76009 RepID=A0ABS5PQA9_9FIRM|nr:GatB/YqeY domain-containing protein [Fusibacter paucivorans]MBS7526771.1 GatB/YqeY domain-containing protein [Fusibacter paucivorans]
MSLKDKLTEDLKSAMKSKDQVKKSTVTMLRAAIKQIEVDERKELTDDEILDIIAKQVKQKNNAIEDFTNGGREDLVDLTKTEIDILMNYMPEQLSDEALEAIVADAIQSTGASTIKDMGKVMGIVTGKTKGQADNKRIADMVKKSLVK